MHEKSLTGNFVSPLSTLFRISFSFSSWLKNECGIIVYKLFRTELDRSFPTCVRVIKLSYIFLLLSYSTLLICSSILQRRLLSFFGFPLLFLVSLSFWIGRGVSGNYDKNWCAQNFSIRCSHRCAISLKLINHRHYQLRCQFDWVLSDSHLH